MKKLMNKVCIICLSPAAFYRLSTVSIADHPGRNAWVTISKTLPMENHKLAAT